MSIGILGAGQLGRMLALAGHPLGFEFKSLAPDPDAPADAVSDLIVADYEDQAALDRFARGLDVVTSEFENVPVATVRRLAERTRVAPPAAALETAQDRLAEKRFFRELGVGTAPFEPVDSLVDLERALEALGTPAVLKTRRWGYDGKGQRRLDDTGDVAGAWDALGGRPLVLEGFVDFDRELSVLATRGTDGDVRVYPVIENEHDHGILRVSIAPAPGLDAALQRRAEEIARRALERLDYVGTLAIELFQRDGELLANEMAPRVHNSGHWTIEGATTSQFENHIRAIAGLPLGATEVHGHVAMVNLIGTTPPLDALLRIHGAAVHLYQKQPRPGRKLGHVTLREDSENALRDRIETLRRSMH
ncbi:MAG: 5-(carboxyamino)imidazole ribonucleotide synthase [Longimicrobiales bacterium]